MPDLVKYVTGECPQLSKHNTVTIEYDEISMLGSIKTQYKKMGYSCSYESSNGCEVSNCEKCPIYLSSPKSICK